MSARPIAVRPRLWLIVAAALTPACFSDGGFHPQGDTALTTEPATTTGEPATTTTGTTTGEPATTTSTTSTGALPAVCGDGIVDPDSEACDDGNRDDSDDCLSDCVAASCGDGVVWSGIEDCDLGAGNHPTAPDTCRPTCKLPACGDGGLYVGPPGPDIVVGTGAEAIAGGDDAPRMIGAAADGSFVVTWRVTGFVEAIAARRIDPDGAPLGGVVEFVQQPLMQLRDPVVAVAPNGDYAVAWEENLDADQMFVGGVAGDVATPVFDLEVPAVSASLALDPGAALVAAYLVPGQKGTLHVHLRRFPTFADPAGPAEQQLSQHDTGLASAPTVALHPDGSFLVAWGDPAGAIVYRRVTLPDLVPGPLVTTGVSVGGGTNANATPWTGAAIRPSDGAAVIVGRDGAGHLVLQRFDADDAPGATVQVDDDDARWIPFVDVVSDPWGNLGVVWSACGAPDDLQANCAELASVSSLRWFYADLTPQGPAAQIATRNGMPNPLSLAIAPTGAAAVSRVEGDKVLVNLSPLQCPR